MTDFTGNSVPSALADARVVDRAGEVHRVASCWADRPCILVFLRHFGCIGCAVAVTELAPRLREIDAAGARTVLIGNGAPSSIAAFSEREALDDKPVTLLTDPSRRAFQAAGLVRSAWATFGPRSLVQGFTARPTDGDNLQQGGALVVDVGGRVFLHRVYGSIGEHVDASDLVDAVLVLAAQQSPMRV